MATLVVDPTAKNDVDAQEAIVLGATHAKRDPSRSVRTGLTGLGHSLLLWVNEP
jgi:hypothetical protein